MSFHYQFPQNSESNNPYLQYIANLDISAKEKLELICIVGSILSYFVDHAFGVTTDQITLGSTGEGRSNAPPDHDTIEHQPDHQTADAQSYGVEEDSCSSGMREP